MNTIFQYCASHQTSATSWGMVKLLMQRFSLSPVQDHLEPVTHFKQLHLENVRRFESRIITVARTTVDIGAQDDGAHDKLHDLLHRYGTHGRLRFTFHTDHANIFSTRRGHERSAKYEPPTADSRIAIRRTSDQRSRHLSKSHRTRSHILRDRGNTVPQRIQTNIWAAR